MRFSEGKIALRVFKILKVSRIIRSQNVLDMIQLKVDEINEFSHDIIDDDDSNDES